MKEFFILVFDVFKLILATLAGIFSFIYNNKSEIKEAAKETVKYGQGALIEVAKMKRKSIDYLIEEHKNYLNKKSNDEFDEKIKSLSEQTKCKNSKID